MDLFNNIDIIKNEITEIKKIFPQNLKMLKNAS